MDSRESAALGLFVCRVTTMIVAYVFALRATDSTVFSALATQIVLNLAVVMRPALDFSKVRKPWAQSLTAYLALCGADKRANFEDVMRGWERNGAAFLLMMTFILYWNIDTYQWFVVAIAMVHGLVLALLLFRVRFALRATCD